MLETGSFTAVNPSNPSYFSASQGGPTASGIFDSGVFITVEPFSPSYFAKSKGGAYPHDSSLPLIPLFFYFAWEPSTSDEFFLSAIQESASLLLNQAIAEGQNVSGPNQIIYSNYALPDTPLSQMFGSNVARLRSIKQEYDPENVMGLAGGFRF